MMNEPIEKPISWISPLPPPLTFPSNLTPTDLSNFFQVDTPLFANLLSKAEKVLGFSFNINQNVNEFSVINATMVEKMKKELVNNQYG